MSSHMKKKNLQREYDYNFDEAAELERLLSLFHETGGTEPPNSSTDNTSNAGHDFFRTKVNSPQATGANRQTIEPAKASLRSLAVDDKEQRNNDPSDDSWKQAVYRKISATLRLSKEILDSDQGISGTIPWFGQMLGGASEMADRGGGWDGLGAASTRGLTDNLLSKTGFDGLGGGVSGIAGSGLEFLSALKGEEDSPNLQIKDAGKVVDLVSTLVSTKGIVAKGIGEGFMGAYNTLNNTLDWAVTGDSTKLLAQYEKQRKGESGEILQGLGMLVDFAGDAITGDWDNIARTATLAEQGKLGTLPKLGVNLDDRALTPFSRPFDVLQNLTEGTTGSARNLLKQEESSKDKPAEFTDPTRKLRSVLPRL